MAELNGYCDPRFVRVHDAMARGIASGEEIGASLCVNIDGENVIDLWGGWRDKAHTSPWTEDTIVAVFSATKTVTSLAVLMLVDRGLIDLHAPVARYWPEFAQNGKDKVLVRHLLSHTAGLPAWEPPFSMAEAMDVPTSTARLAAQAPWWEPGTRGSYHASSFGHLNGELVRRVAGVTLSQFIAKEITSPLGAAFYLGLTDESLLSRVATIYPAPEKQPGSGSEATAAEDDGLSVERTISARTRLGSFSGLKREPLVLFNSPEWRRTEFGGSSGHSNAQGLGRILAALSLGGVSQGVRLLSPAVIGMIFQEQAHGIDSYYMRPIRWGIGYALASEEDNRRGPLPFLRPGRKTCFWYGSGGSLAIADVERRITYTYAMNQCQSGRSALNGVYYKAFHDCLGA
jgi:CubicO group peptidase (beta-lactamase class C family)